MGKLTFRDLRADEIELRVGATTETGFSLLLYKTARVDANILDETVGPFNWQKRFYQVKNTMICSVGINVNYDDETKEPYWVWKDDAGDESNTEAIKGEASDSFKRAGFAWGIGRALYTSPFVWITKDQNNDPKKSHYSVSEIGYTNGEISKLVITNDKTKQVVFSYGSATKVSKNADLVGQKAQTNVNTTAEGTIRQEDKTFIDNYIGNLSMEEYGSFFNWLDTKFKVRNVAKLSAEQGVIIVNSIKRKLGEK